MLNEPGNEALLLLGWWLSSATFTPGMGVVSVGSPEWPFRGGWLNQPSRLVDAVEIMKCEWRHVTRATPKQAKPPAPPKRPPRPRRR